MWYYAVIECVIDGLTYTQKYREFEDLVDLVLRLGRHYKVVDIYG